MKTNRYHHLTWHHGIGVFEARLTSQAFSRHSHAGFAIGAITDGVGGYLCRGENMILPPGTLSLMNPEEAHTGQAHSNALRYNMMYVSEDAVRQILGIQELRGFKDVIPADRQFSLSHALKNLETQLNNPQSPGWRLAVEEAVHDVLAVSFQHHGQVNLKPEGHEPAAVRTTRDMIRDATAQGQDITLKQLADSTGLSMSYLIRCFSRWTGLTPHAYLLQCKVERACEALVSGQNSPVVAQDAGFYDQSHMIRHMRRLMGVTPKHLLVH